MSVPATRLRSVLWFFDGLKLIGLSVNVLTYAIAHIFTLPSDQYSNSAYNEFKSATVETKSVCHRMRNTHEWNIRELDVRIPVSQQPCTIVLFWFHDEQKNDYHHLGEVTFVDLDRLCRMTDYDERGSNLSCLLPFVWNLTVWFVWIRSISGDSDYSIQECSRNSREWKK